MPAQRHHPWQVTPQAAIDIQNRLRHHVIRTDGLARVHLIAGVDVGYVADGSITRAVVAVLTYPELQLQATSVAHRSTTFPYLSGLLSFREVPAILEALATMEPTPDLLLCDGQGLAHPRRFGLACHLGFLSDIPAIGVAKTRLVGVHDPVPDIRGAWRPLQDKGETVGAVLRTRPKIKPIYVSLGHRISLETAVDYVMNCSPKYRLPEPIRQAHRLASGR